MIKAIFTGAVLALLAVTLPCTAAPHTPKEQTMYQSAQTFLATLTPEQKAKAAFPFNSEERLNWFYIPKDRKGLPYKAMTPEQQKAATDLLKTGLSQKGFEKTATLRQLENVLKEMEKGTGPVRDPDLYYFTVFGEPAEKGAWGWRYEGHHVSLHWTVIDGKIRASSPQFLGSNPGEVREGPMKGTRILATEEDLGRQLVTALQPDQQQVAVIAHDAPSDVLTGNQRVAAIQEDKGIAYKALTKEQQGILLTLIREHASIQKPATARQRLDAIRKAGLDTIKFAWMGSLEPGKGHYYRVQGSTFLIEYDNTQNNANHVHAVWRDFKNDFGRDLLGEHYQEFPHPHEH